MTKKIPLSKGKSYAIINDIDYNYLMNWKWSFAKSNGYALRYFINEEGKRGAIYMHRVVMTRMLGDPIPDGMQVDHIIVGESSRLDNRRDNLRLTSRSENQWHKRTPKNSSTGFTGVTYHAGKFEAHIRVYGERIYLGRFATAEDAALMRDAASRVFHGEFAYPNLPDTPTPPHIRQKLDALLQNRHDTN